MNLEEALDCAEKNHLWAIKHFLNLQPLPMNHKCERIEYMRRIRRIITTARWSADRTRAGCLNDLDDFIRIEILHLS